MLRQCITLLLVLAVGVAVGWWLPRYDVQPKTYAEQRLRFVEIQAELVAPVDTIVLGDSITESNVLDGLCGKTFNAGIGGATVPDIARAAPVLITKSRARRTVLAVGTNDVILKSQTFRPDYRALLDRLPLRPFALVGVRGGDNAFIAGEAKRIGAAYVSPLPNRLTWDGIHPTAAGARVWREMVAKSCPAGG